jgi:hypothetical protein
MKSRATGEKQSNRLFDKKFINSKNFPASMAK